MSIPPTGTAAGSPGATDARPLDDPATLRAFAHRLREGLYVADAEGRLLDANAALAALVGAEAAALGGRRLDELVADPAARRAALAGLAVGGGARDVDVELVAPGGARTLAVESVVAVADGAGGTRLHGIVVPVSVARAARGVAAGAPGATAAATAAGGEGAMPERDRVTGCLDRSHLTRLGAAMARDPRAAAGAVVVRLEAHEEHVPGDTLELGELLSIDERRERVARFLMRHVRGNEPVVRLGDDEFLVVLAGAVPDHVERVARRIQLLALRGAPGPLSMGWASRERGESLVAVVARAAQQRIAVPIGGRVEDDRRRAEDHGDEALAGVGGAGAGVAG